jgi:hypothetical protein
MLHVLLKRLTAALVVMLFSLNGHGQDFSESQDRVKAIYLYNFIKNIEWNNESAGDFKVCLLKKDDFYTSLEKLVITKKKGMRNILVEEIASVGNCSKCDLVFLNETQNDHIAKRDPKCLSLFVTTGFYEKTFTDIALLYHDNKLSFAINTELCTKEGFKIPTTFLSLANQKLIQ